MIEKDHPTATIETIQKVLKNMIIMNNGMLTELTMLT